MDMGKSFGLNHLIPLAIIVVGAVFHSCKDDVFDPEKVKQTYQDKFPVKDIDPNMDWKMTTPVAINVSVIEDAGVDYTVRIYDKNPLTDQSDANLLAEGIANNTTPFTTIMDCPSILTEVFVCRIDNHNRSVMKYVSIENNQVNAAFGTPRPSTRASWTQDGGIEIETYTPEKSEKEIKSLLSDATEITNGTDYLNGEVYKISKGKTFEGSITKGGLGDSNPAIIIIEGKWEPRSSVEVQRGFQFYVLDGGEIKIPDYQTLSIVEGTNFIIYEGGTLKGNNLTLTNASNSRYNYNAGTIDINKFHASMGGTFYNCGKVDVKIMEFTSGCRFVNQGKAHIGSTDSNLTIENGCYLKADCLVCTLYMGNNSGATIEDFGNASNNYNTHVYMGNNAILTITDDAQLDQAQFTGPSSQYALVKIDEIESIASFQSKGNIYYEIKEISSKVTNDSWHKNFLDAIKNSQGTISKWGESPIVIPPGDCTSDGNTPIDQGSGTPANPLKYTYVFEDNFPLVGDYDFNDIVLDVAISYIRKDDNYNANNKIKKMQIDVTLAATGAGKVLGAGLRLVGISRNIIDEIETGGADDRYEKTLEDKNSLFKNIHDHMEEGDKDVVIPLFGNAHKVFDNVTEGMMVNTDPAGLVRKTTTYEIIIEFKDDYRTANPQITKDNLDFFICYKYKNMDKRMEVHLYEFWDYGATAAGTVQQTNLDLAGNNTWAICVPDFRYPKELINISNQKDDSDCAYPLFLNWARDRNQSPDWYEHPNENNVYR